MIVTTKNYLTNISLDQTSIVTNKTQTAKTNSAQRVVSITVNLAILKIGFCFCSTKAAFNTRVTAAYEISLWKTEAPETDL